MSYQAGDWLEHVGLMTPRATITRRAEVLSDSGSNVSLYIDNEPGYRTIARVEVLRWWEPMPLPQNDPPEGFSSGMLFSLQGKPAHRAILANVKPGWVSFFEYLDQHGPSLQVFRMLQVADFERCWNPVSPPNVWSRLLCDVIE